MHSQQLLNLCKPSLCAHGHPLRLSEELLRVLFFLLTVEALFHHFCLALCHLSPLHHYTVMPERKKPVVPR